MTYQNPLAYKSSLTSTDFLDSLERSQGRVSLGRRPRSTSRLKPDISHSDDGKIMQAVEDDLAIRPDLVPIVGAKLIITRARSVVENLYHATQYFGGASF